MAVQTSSALDFFSAPLCLYNMKTRLLRKELPDIWAAQISRFQQHKPRFPSQNIKAEAARARPDREPPREIV